jgi:hypothetical protein
MMRKTDAEKTITKRYAALRKSNKRLDEANARQYKAAQARERAVAAYEAALTVVYGPRKGSK